MVGGFRGADAGRAEDVRRHQHAFFGDNSDTMGQLLGDLVTTTELMYMRVRRSTRCSPNYRGSLFDSLSSIIHDNGFWMNMDIYPRYTCDYGTPRQPPASADYPEPFMYTYCRDDDPAVLIRGAKNARGRPVTTPTDRRRELIWQTDRSVTRRAGTRSRLRTAARRCRWSHRGKVR